MIKFLKQYGNALFLIMFAAAIVFAACSETRQDVELEERRRYIQIVHDIHYMKDIHTDLCFAFSQDGRGVLMTNVPCTPEVIKRLY